MWLKQSIDLGLKNILSRIPIPITGDIQLQIGMFKKKILVSHLLKHAICAWLSTVTSSELDLVQSVKYSFIYIGVFFVHWIGRTV